MRASGAGLIVLLFVAGWAAGCANNPMAMRGQLEQYQQQTVELAQQTRELQARQWRSAAQAGTSPTRARAIDQRSATGVTKVVTITMMTIAEKTPSLTTPSPFPMLAKMRPTSPRGIIPTPMESRSTFGRDGGGSSEEPKMRREMDPPKDLVAILRDGALVQRALEKAARQAIEEHRRDGRPLAMWRDGRVTWVPAEELQTESADRS